MRSPHLYARTAAKVKTVSVDPSTRTLDHSPLYLRYAAHRATRCAGDDTHQVSTALVSKQCAPKEMVNKPPGRSARCTLCSTSVGRIKYWMVKAKVTTSTEPGS